MKEFTLIGIIGIIGIVLICAAFCAGMEIGYNIGRKTVQDAAAHYGFGHYESNNEFKWHLKQNT